MFPFYIKIKQDGNTILKNQTKVQNTQKNEVSMSNFFSELINNDFITVAFWSWFIAQVLKTIIHLAVIREFNWERLVGSGGMPSSHSSTVTSLATIAFFQFGASSFEFAFAFIFALVVMHDASGVRQETGKQARILNEMMELLADMSNSVMPMDEKLKEFVGHTKLQVAMGAILGIVVACVYYYFL